MGKMKYYSISLILFWVVTLFRDHYDLYQFYLCILDPESGKLRGDEMAGKKSMADFGHSQVNLETFINPWIHKCHIHFHKTVKVQQENEVTELFHKTRLIPKL